MTGGTLAVAKLVRLSRNVAFLAADMPEANELTVHIMAAIAQAERKMIASRARDAVAAVKALGRSWATRTGLHRSAGLQRVTARPVKLCGPELQAELPTMLL